jgi:hypothetical protein
MSNDFAHRMVYWLAFDQRQQTACLTYKQRQHWQQQSVFAAAGTAAAAAAATACSLIQPL